MFKHFGCKAKLFFGYFGCKAKLLGPKQDFCSNFLDAKQDVCSNILNAKQHFCSNILGAKQDFCSNILGAKQNFCSNFWSAKQDSCSNKIFMCEATLLFKHLQLGAKQDFCNHIVSMFASYNTVDVHRKAGHGEERQLLGMNCESKHAMSYYFAVHAQVMTERQQQYTQSGHASLCKQCCFGAI